MKCTATKSQSVNNKRTESGVRRKAIDDDAAPDSCPTPILMLGYRQIYDIFISLAKRFNDHAIALSNQTEVIDKFIAEECRTAANNLRQLAERALKLPNHPDISIERSYLCEQFSSYLIYAQKIITKNIE